MPYAFRWPGATLAVALVALCAAAHASENERPIGDLRAHNSAISHVRFNHDGTLLASAGAEPGIFVWNVERRSLVRKVQPIGRSVSGRSELVAPTRRIESFALSPTSNLLADAADEGASEGFIRLWNPADGSSVRVLAEKVRNIRAVEFSPDGQLVAANLRAPSEAQHRIVLFDVQTGAESRRLTGDRLAATLLTFSPDGTRLVSAGGNNICVWDPATGKAIHNFEAHTKPVRAIRVSPDGKLLASCADDDLIRVWDMAAGSKVREIEAEQDGVNDVAFSASGQTLASAGDDHTIKLWEPVSGLHVKSLWTHLDRVLCLDFSPDGKLLASGSADKTIALWQFTDPTLSAKDRRKKEKEAEEKEKEKQQEKEKEERRKREGG